jgi:CRP-like cAMP-binding protein
MNQAKLEEIRSNLRSEFLDGLAPSGRNQLLEAATLRQCLANSVLTHQGTPADRLFLLVIGRARYFFVTPDGRKVLLFALLPGDTLGGAALLSRSSEYHVSSETVEDSSILMWDRKTIRSFASRYPRLLENELSTASDYLIWYVATHLALTCQTAQSRLAHVLCNLSQGIGRHGRGTVELDITNQELAYAANLAEFTVSRLLGDWQRQGFIAKKRGKVVVRSHEELLRSLG